jgi:hypothetical protein
MTKRLLAVIGGILLGATVIFLVESLIHTYYPPPEGLDVTDKAALAEFVATLPLGALLGVLLAWGAGAFVAGWFGAWVSPVSPLRHSLLCGIGLTVMALMNMVNIPHPGWFWVPGLLVHLPLALLGGRLTGKRG